MAGFYRLYVIGQPGGFQGADGVNNIQLIILVGTAGREWLEAHYFDPALKPLGQIRTIIPERPDTPDALLDACLVFFPDHFTSCPSMAVVKAKIGQMTQLDFHLGPDRVPADWDQLRSEARSLFNELSIWEAELREVER
jgi:hypothetical protein